MPKTTRKRFSELRERHRSEHLRRRRVEYQAAREEEKEEGGSVNDEQTDVRKKFELDNESFHVSEEQLDNILDAMLHNKKATVEGQKEIHKLVFGDVDRNLLKATLLFYLNSGCARFEEDKFHCASKSGKRIDIEKVVGEIMNEKISEDEIIEKIKMFDNCHPNIGHDLLTCCACGLRMAEEKYTRVELKDTRAQKFQYNSVDEAVLVNNLEGNKNVLIYIDEHTTKEVNPWRAKSFYLGKDNKYYHFHPEFVEDQDGIEWVTLCGDCVVQEKKKGEWVLPKRSISAGVDFGYFKRLGLVKANLHEQMALSFNRLFFTVYKIVCGTSGEMSFTERHKNEVHAVLFGQDCPEKCAQCLEELIRVSHLTDNLHILLLDEKGDFDRLAEKILKSHVLTVRWWNLVSYLRVLNVISSTHQRGKVPSVDEVKRSVEEAVVYLKDNMSQEHDRSIIQEDEKVGDDTTRFHAEIGEEFDGEQEMSIEVSCVLDDRHYLAGHENRKVARSCLYALGRAMNPEMEKKKKESSDEYELDNTDDTVSTVQSQDDAESDDESCMMIDSGETSDEFITQGDWDKVEKAVKENFIRSQREESPINEFTNPHLLGETFPTTFMFGSAYSYVRTPNLGSRELNHLLHQFTNVPSTDYRLLGYLGDVKSRFQVMQNVVAHVKNNNKAQDSVARLLEDKEKQEELDEAINNPDTKEAEKVFAEYLPHLQFAGKNVDQGIFQAFEFKSQCLESTRRYGPPTGFATFSFDNIDNPVPFRAIFASVDNKSFPAVFSDESVLSSPEVFLEKLRELSHDETSFEFEGHKFNRQNREAASKENPVVYVDECKRMISDVCRILLGLPLEHFFERNVGESRRRTWCYTCNKGVLGHCLAIIGVMEDHAKGTLHFHLVFYGGLPPFVLQQYGCLEEIREAICRVLDTQFQSSLPAEVLLRQLIKNAMKFKIPARSNIDPMGVDVSPLLKRTEAASVVVKAKAENKTVQETMSEAVRESARSRFHFHGHTCRQGPMGRTGCRLCMPSDTLDQTGPVLLVPNEEYDSNKDEKLSYKVGPVVQTPGSDLYLVDDFLNNSMPSTVMAWEIKCPEINAENMFPGCKRGESTETSISRADILANFKNLLEHDNELSGWNTFQDWLQKLPEEDLRKFYRELYDLLERANGYVPCFNVMISHLTGSHNNVVLLGSTDQASGAIFYMCPYMGKKKVPLLQSMAIIRSAARHVIKVRSQAEDHEHLNRKTKFFYERVLNKLNLKFEASAYQLVAKLLGLPSIISTEKYSYLKPSAEISAHILLERSGSTILENLSEQNVLFRQLGIGNDDTNRITEADVRTEMNRRDEGDESVGSESKDEESVLDDEENLEGEPEYKKHTPLSEEEMQSLLEGLGSSKCYVVEKPGELNSDDDSNAWPNSPSIKQLVPHSLLYPNRGKQLRHLNLYKH